VENTQLNDTPNVKCAVSDLLKQTEKVEGGYQVAAANIVADVIIRLAPDIGAYLADDGVLIVSGIIIECADEVLDVLEQAGFTKLAVNEKEGWAAALLQAK
jgi:ribosomal protein L11 methyltransferase